MCEDFFFFIKISSCFFQMVGKRSSRDYTHAIHMCAEIIIHGRTVVYTIACVEKVREYMTIIVRFVSEKAARVFFSDLL